jgi:hypothetical protein
MKFKYVNIADNLVEVEKFSEEESRQFPLGWLDKYPAAEGGDSVIQTLDKVLELETRDFEDTSIRINLTNAYGSWDDMDESEIRMATAVIGLKSRAIKGLLQKLMDDLLELDITKAV